MHLSLVTMLAYLTAALAAMLAQSAFAQGPGSGVRIASYDNLGSGCPRGSVAATLSPDQQALTLVFSQFMAIADPRHGTDKKDCNVAIDLDVPAGWTYTVYSVDYRGYLALDHNSDARLRSWYSLGGVENIRIANMKIEGPYDGNYTNRAWVQPDTLPWLDCTANAPTRRRMVLSTELKAEGDNAMLTVDSTDVAVVQTYGIAWRRCSASTRWQGECQAVLETVWGSDMNRFNATALGANHPDAKNGAKARALSQCETQRSGLRPLLRATTRCIVDGPTCLARPL